MSSSVEPGEPRDSKRAKYAQVALLTQSVTIPFTYAVPEALSADLQVGSAVAVPLQSRLVSGIVVALDAGSPVAKAVKPVHSLFDPQPALNARQMALAGQISSEYHSPIGRCCALMVPPGYTPKSSFSYSLADIGAARIDRMTKGSAMHARLVTLLQSRGALTEAQLKTHMRGARGWRDALKAWVAAGSMLRAPTLEAVKSQPRRQLLAQLIIGADTLEVVLRNLNGDAEAQPRRAATLARRMAALRYLIAHNSLAWADWIGAETDATREDLTWLSEQGYVLLGDAQRWRDPLADVDYVVKTPPPLTPDQKQAWDVIRDWDPAAAGGRPAHFLVRGVTGSGKTEIYMRAVEQALAAGRGALVLVPEISLTPQTARRFLERFPGQVALIHSKLKPGERVDSWRRIRSGELNVVVGARSALFAPMRDIGLIVLDEEHDSSYKQSATPFYDARRVAVLLAHQHSAKLIFGSATPSLESWHAALPAPGYVPAFQVLELPNRVRGHVSRLTDQQARLGLPQIAPQPETDSVMYQALPPVQVVDMRAELLGGNTSMFSGALKLALDETLRRGEQAILFLNRRGSASCVVCRDCGHAMRCPNDDAPLTLHNIAPKAGGEPSKLLKCHQCNHSEPVPARCPVCNRPRIRFIGLGTQKIEQAIHEQFPGARVVRWDKDASTGADNLLQRFVERKADVLVGTQMIAKGLDLPMVTLVGVVLADVGLFLPDFRATERVFNLMAQVAGRAGRGLLPGRVIVQTYNPDNPAITFAAKHDVQGFAKYALAERKALNLPPYIRLVRFEIDAPTSEEARGQCEALARVLRARSAHPSDVIGPAQAYFARRERLYRWQILVRTPLPGALLDRLEVPPGCVVDVDPESVL